jgi:uracil-DNA glycosylase
MNDNKTDTKEPSNKDVFLLSMLSPVHKSWRKIFVSNPRILDIISKVCSDLINKTYPTEYTPSTERIFRVFSMPIDNIKVVIVGQDPYPNPEDPDGLAFSTQSKICPKSLNTIFTALKQSRLIDEKPSSFDLTPWHNQGVFLLNTTLTVEPHKSNSHVHLWDGFTEIILSTISDFHKSKTLKFMLWGAKAQSLESSIISSSLNHDVLKWSHPAARVGGDQAFKFCDHFTKATADFKIDWNLNLQLQKPNVESQQTQSQQPQQDEKEVKFSLESYFKGKTVWFTDGSCLGNGPKSTSFEWGVFKCYENGNKINKSFGGTDTKKTQTYNPSNIKGEGKAILFVLENLNPLEKNILYTDSQFWVNMITDFMPKWHKRGEKFENKANPELTIPIFNAYNVVKDSLQLEFINAYHNFKPKTELESFIYAGNKRAEDIAKSFKNKNG